MKLFFCFLILLTLVSCATIREDKISKLRKSPPGTIRLNDSLFIDVTEIGNVHWREFVYWTKEIGKDSIGVINNLPDTTVWSINAVVGQGKAPYSQVYYEHPSFNYYPVVGITFKQAEAFCKWRSDRVNEIFEKYPERNPLPYKKYKYRLLTIKEWESAAENLDSISKRIPIKFRKKNNFNLKYIANIYKGDSVSGLNDVKSYTTEIDNYLPNKFGVYNMIGNVSEMTATKGIAKGGNFLLPLDSCKINGQQIYLKPEAWLGFRCVCEIVKE